MAGVSQPPRRDGPVLRKLRPAIIPLRPLPGTAVPLPAPVQRAEVAGFSQPPRRDGPVLRKLRLAIIPLRPLLERPPLPFRFGGWLTPATLARFLLSRFCFQRATSATVCDHIEEFFSTNRKPKEDKSWIESTDRNLIFPRLTIKYFEFQHRYYLFNEDFGLSSMAAPWRPLFLLEVFGNSLFASPAFGSTPSGDSKND